jgi:hypothetical protein
VAAEGRCAFRFAAPEIVAGTRTLRQQVMVAGLGAGDSLTLRLAARADGLRGRAFAQVRVAYADGTAQTLRIALPAGTYRYAGFAESLTLRAAPTRVTVTLIARDSAGRIWIDDLRLEVASGAPSEDDPSGGLRGGG